MRFVISILALSAFVAICQAEGCSTITLQENIDFARIQGIWNQLRYTPNTYYDDMRCFGFLIENLDNGVKAFKMTTFLKPYPEVKKGMDISQAFMTLISYASYGKREEGKEYIGDHIATDYDNYLIFYQCDDEGNALVDVEIRRGVILSDAQKKEINEYLDKIGTDFDSLEEEDSSYCPVFTK